MHSLLLIFIIYLSTTFFKNKKGGTSIVFGKIKSADNYVFFFLCFLFAHTAKEMLIFIVKPNYLCIISSIVSLITL